MRVLLIEPDHILAKEILKSFNNEGIEVVCCDDAQQAISIVDEQIPDVIVLELQLAGHSGVEFLHELRSYQDWTKIPIFVFSCIPEYSFNTSDKTWKKLGVIRYFYKPKTSIKQLIGAIKSS